MNSSLPSFLSVLLLLGAATFAQAQKAQNPQPVSGAPQVVQRPRPAMPGFVGNSNASNAAKPLSSNYRIVFTGKSGDKALGELSLLTASPVVAISGPLDASPMPTSFEVSGTIEEREGGLIVFEYRIGFQVPVTTTIATNQSNVPGTSYSSVQYYNHTCSGSLVMKPGKAYDVLKAGGNTHSVMITPEVDK